uniref:putative uncharacterized protein DDB_G0285135 n=1 Tax=Myxine glutinosa TaxID=7769 RepID=UPI00358EC2FF
MAPVVSLGPFPYLLPSSSPNNNNNNDYNNNYNYNYDYNNNYNYNYNYNYDYNNRGAGSVRPHTGSVTPKGLAVSSSSGAEPVTLPRTQ